MPQRRTGEPIRKLKMEGRDTASGGFKDARGIQGSTRLEELQAAAAERHGTTIDSLTEELEKARETAMDTGQVSAAVSAIMGKARLHGLIKPNNDATPLIPASAPPPVINVILSNDKP